MRRLRIRWTTGSVSSATPKNLAFISFYQATIAELKRQLPEYKAHLLLGTNWWQRDNGEWVTNQPYFTSEECVRRLKACRADGLDFEWNSKIAEQGAAFVKAIKDAGFEFHYWCVDNREDAVEALRRGADILTSNRPAAIVGGVRKSAPVHVEQLKRFRGDVRAEGQDRGRSLRSPSGDRAVAGEDRRCDRTRRRGDGAAELYRELFPEAKKVLVIDDVNTKRVAGDRVIALLKAAGVEVAEHTINPDGSWFHATYDNVDPQLDGWEGVVV